MNEYEIDHCDKCSREIFERPCSYCAAEAEAEKPKKKKSKRDPLDRYYTPVSATEPLLAYLGDRLAGKVHEPCCGADWIGRALRVHEPVTHYLGTDIDPDADSFHWSRGRGRGTDMPARDFLVEEPFAGVDWYVSNPPFVIKVDGRTVMASDFVKKMLSTGASVAMLLRLTMLEPCKDRAQILFDDPPTDLLILPRVHYINAKNQNNCTSAWFIWDRERGEKGRTLTTWLRFEI